MTDKNMASVLPRLTPTQQDVILLALSRDVAVTSSMTPFPHHLDLRMDLQELMLSKRQDIVEGLRRSPFWANGLAPIIKIIEETP